MSEVVKVESEGTQRTNLYKTHLQKIIEKETGKKVSKEVAWNLFKAIINGTTEFVLREGDNNLPLSGIGFSSCVRYHD